MLNQDLAKRIVSKTMAILGKNINLMDEKAIIIASGDEKRIGDFHEGAAKAIKADKTVEIGAAEAKKLRGVRPGVNLPIYLHNRIVGVVGITGDPEEVRGYGELVRHTAELMLEQEALREQIHLQEKAKDSLIQDLTGGGWIKDPERTILRGRLVGFNLEIPRVVIVFDIINFGQKVRSYLDDPHNSRISGEVRIQQLKEAILQAINGALPGLEEITSFIGNNRIILFKTLEYAPVKNDPVLTPAIVRCQEAVVHTTGLQLLAGIGGYHPGLQGLQKSYEEAVAALQISRKLPNTGGISTIKELKLEFLINQLSHSAAAEYYRELLKGLATQGKKANTQIYIDTLAALFKNDLNISLTARELFIHRNTLLFRLEKIKDATGLNPVHFSDAVKLYIGLMLYYLKENPH